MLYKNNDKSSPDIRPRLGKKDGTGRKDGQGAKAKENEDIIKMPKCNPDDIGFITSYPNANEGCTHTICISEPIMNSRAYLALIATLIDAGKNDEVIIKLASPGGAVDIGIAICNAIHNTKAIVTTTAIGMTASIAAVIWACGHKKSMTPSSVLMFHMPSGLVFGKTADVEEETGYIQEYFTNLLGKVTKGILTEAEFEQMIKGRRDIFISYQLLKDRLSKGVV